LSSQRNEAFHSKLVRIKRRLKRVGVEWTVFAGAAAFCYGSKRAITDIDILIRCEDLRKAKKALEGINLEGFDVGCGAEITTPQGMCPFFLDDEMIKRIEWRQLFGVNVPVMSAEDNIVLKGILQRGENEGKHDIEDIKSMIAHEKIDLEYLEYRMRKCHAEKRAKPLFQTLIKSLL
jgi:hypothetical protein